MVTVLLGEHDDRGWVSGSSVKRVVCVCVCVCGMKTGYVSRGRLQEPRGCEWVCDEKEARDDTGRPETIPTYIIWLYTEQS